MVLRRRSTITSIWPWKNCEYYDGSIFLANTRSTTGALLPSLGPTSISWSGGGGNGVYYNSCWVSSAQNAVSKYSVLSFREVLDF
jgi:hypothetical protein